MKKRNRGFTLIELVFVLALLATLIGLATPPFQRSYRRLGLDVGARSLAASLAYARERAVMERVETRVVLDCAANRWRLESRDAETGLFAERRDRWARARAAPQGTTMSSDAPFATFRPDGTAEPVSARITAAGEGAVQVAVDPVLGRVRMEYVDENE